jgi:hypothetical protein
MGFIPGNNNVIWAANLAEVHAARSHSIKEGCVRSARFTRSGDPPFWETPKPMTTFAVSFMRNKAKNNAEMQR